MNKLIINHHQLINIVNDDLQKNIIELAHYFTLLKNNTIKKDINYEKKIIENVKYLNILTEDLKFQTQKSEKLINTLNCHIEESDISNISNDCYIIIVGVKSILLTIIISSFFVISPVLIIPIMLISFTTTTLFAFRKAIFKVIKHMFNKKINKKINKKNKFFKDKFLKNLLIKNKVTQKKYFEFKKCYLSNIYQKILNNFNNNKNNENNFDSNGINSLDLQNKPSTSEYKPNSPKM